MRKQLITLGTAATMVLGGLALTSGSANAGTAAAAADRNFQASCTSAGKKFSVGVYYTPKDGYDRITSYSFSFKGSDIGDRNQVRLRIREEKVGPDKNLWQWESSKVTRSGHTRNPNIRFATRRSGMPTSGSSSTSRTTVAAPASPTAPDTDEPP
jgi:hypothetical protein